MTLVAKIAQFVTQWLDVVAETISARTRTRKARRIVLVEGEDSLLLVRDGPANFPSFRFASDGAALALPEPWLQTIRGAAVVLILSPARAVTRSLDLPTRGIDFLQGIIRSQIDRITPWSVDEAVFQHGQPRTLNDDQVSVTVVATSRSALKPLVQPFLACGAIRVETVIQPPDEEPLTLHVERAKGRGETVRLRQALAIGLGGGILGAMLSIGLGGYLIQLYNDQLGETQRRIAKHRAMISQKESRGRDSPLDLMLRRRQSSPFVVLVLEDLSALLPDNTFVTELRIEGDKLQLKGFTQDSLALIRLLERSPHFVNAGFFAPTTRTAGEAGERFNLETQVKTRFGPRS